jgi:hypothetical protein
MNGFVILELGIGLSLVYLLLALIAMSLMEWITQALERRGKTLIEALPRLLGEEGSATKPITTALLDHALIRGLSDTGTPPSYIPSSVFAAALTDTLKDRKVDVGTPSIPTQLDATLRALTSSTVSEQDNKTAIATWYDQCMDRVSGTFKRRTRKWVFAIAALITLALNADSLTLVKTLWNDPTLRTYLVERAKTRLEQGPPLPTVEYTNPLDATPSAPDTTASALSPTQLLSEEQTLVGWLITILAVSLGAPFWFDALNRLTSIRAAGSVPQPAVAKTEG